MFFGLISNSACSVVRRRLARNSASENLKNEIFVELFPDLVKEIKESVLKQRLEREQRETDKDENETQNRQNVERNQNVENQRQTESSIISHLGFFALILGFAVLAGMPRIF